MNLFDINLLFEQLKEEQSLIDEFNKQLHTLDERKRRICKIRPTDSANKIRKKCKVARVWGIHYAPVWDRYVGNQSGTDTSSTDVSGNGDSASANGGMAAETAFLYPSSIGSEYDTKTINDEITYLSPNAELEWNEAVRYPELKSLGKSKWEDLLNKGKVIPWEFLSDVKNYEEDLEQIDRDKLQKQVQAPVTQNLNYTGSLNVNFTAPPGVNTADVERVMNDLLKKPEFIQMIAQMAKDPTGKQNPSQQNMNFNR